MYARVGGHFSHDPDTHGAVVWSTICDLFLTKLICARENVARVITSRINRLMQFCRRALFCRTIVPIRRKFTLSEAVVERKAERFRSSPFGAERSFRSFHLPEFPLPSPLFSCILYCWQSFNALCGVYFRFSFFLCVYLYRQGIFWCTSTHVSFVQLVLLYNGAHLNLIIIRGTDPECSLSENWLLVFGNWYFMQNNKSFESTR